MAFYDGAINDLDRVIDLLRRKATLLTQTGGVDRRRGQELRDAAAAVASVRNEMLADNYDRERERERENRIKGRTA